MHHLFNRALHSRNGLVRKGTALLLQAPKRLSRPLARPAAYAALPPVLANSFPKSGTHLLDQIVDALPGRRSYGEFLSSMTSSFRFRRRSPDSVCRVLQATIPGEIVRAHLFYDDSVRHSLRKLSFIHYFIHRDPRDVALSEAHYYRSINRWHRLHPIFRDAPRLDDAIMLAIEGIDDPTGRIYYPNIGMRFKHYGPWIKEADVCAARFEDLTSGRREGEIRRMMEFYAARTAGAADVASLTEQAIRSIAPEKSHTFRKGGQGGWREAFTDAHREAFKRHAGNVLIEYGYETNENW
jgi:hypothetical protein